MISWLQQFGAARCSRIDVQTLCDAGEALGISRFMHCVLVLKYVIWNTARVYTSMATTRSHMSMTTKLEGRYQASAEQQLVGTGF